jgi:anti-sigma factor RsiW
VRSSFSDYLDGAVDGRRMQEMALHLDECSDCSREFSAWRSTQDALASLGSAKAPAELALRLRLAIIGERTANRPRLRDRLALSWERAVRPMLLQVTGGVVGSLALVAGVTLLLGVVSVPQTVQANDEPLGAITAPHYLYSAGSPEAIITDHDTAIVVEASVDSRGRVYDYRIVSGPTNEAVRKQVTSELLGRVYQPASAFGVAVRGRIVVTFSGISVHG